MLSLFGLLSLCVSALGAASNFEFLDQVSSSCGDKNEIVISRTTLKTPANSLYWLGEEEDALQEGSASDDIDLLIVTEAGDLLASLDDGVSLFYLTDNADDQARYTYPVPLREHAKDENLEELTIRGYYAPSLYNSSYQASSGAVSSHYGVLLTRQSTTAPFIYVTDDGGKSFTFVSNKNLHFFDIQFDSIDASLDERLSLDGRGSDDINAEGIISPDVPVVLAVGTSRFTHCDYKPTCGHLSDKELEGGHTSLSITADGGLEWAKLDAFAMYPVMGARRFVDAKQRQLEVEVMYVTQHPGADPQPFRDCFYPGVKCDLVSKTITVDTRDRHITKVSKATTIETNIKMFQGLSWSGTMYDPHATRDKRIAAYVREDGTGGGRSFHYTFNAGKKWRHAEWPFGSLPKTTFPLAVVDNEEGALAVLIESTRNDVLPNEGLGPDLTEDTSRYARDKAYDLYISDGREVNAQFSLALKNVHSRGVFGFFGLADFERGQGVNGLYFANVYRTDPKTGLRSDSCLQTLVSYDNGARWTHMLPPRAELTICLREHFDDVSKCYLHLHGLTDGNERVYSAADAPGIVIAQGSVGECLVDKRSAEDSGALGSYVSRDGGASWKRFGHGAHMYEIGNQGSLIVTGRANVAKTYFSYSLDQGDIFLHCEYSDDKVVGENIISRSFGARSFLLYGMTDDKDFETESTGVITFISFNRTHDGRVCGEDDYEWWSPTDAAATFVAELNETSHDDLSTSDATCILGAHTKIRRRKQFAACHNDRSTAVARVETTPCPCQLDDYECDFCYEPADGAEFIEDELDRETGLDKSGNALCTQTDSAFCNEYLKFSSVEKRCRADPTGKYYTTKGFRLIAHNQCDKDAGSTILDLRPEAHECADLIASLDSSGGGIVFLVLLLLSCIALAGAAVAQSRGIINVPILGRLNGAVSRIARRSEAVPKDDYRSAGEAGHSLLGDGDHGFGDDDDEDPESGVPARVDTNALADALDL
jgi:hypothetical protein